MSTIGPTRSPVKTPTIDPIVVPGSMPWDRGEGGAAFSPASASFVIDGFDPSTLAAGSVASWVGLKRVLTLSATGAQQPTAGPTVFNSRPGISFDGNDALGGPLGALVSTLSGLTLTFAYLDASTSLEVLCQTDGNLATDRIEIATNDGVAGSLEAIVSGTGFKRGTEDFSTARYVSVGFDKTIDRGISYIRVNGSAISLANQGGAVTPGGTWTFTSFFWGAFDASGSSGCTGKCGALVISQLLVDGSANLNSVEQWVRAKGGL